MEELESCPFCGKSVEVFKNPANIFFTAKFFIQCECGIKTLEYSRKNRVIKVWNTRV